MRKILMLLCLGALLVVASSCIRPMLSIRASPETGIPTVAAGGLLVTFHLVGQGRETAIAFGDGLTAAIWKEKTTVSHLYTSAGEFTCTATGTTGVASVVITVLDDPPRVLPPMYNKIAVGLWEFMHFNPHPGYAGCDAATGRPMLQYGVSDPDGDEADLELSWFAWNRSTGEAEAIYNRAGQYINGTWVPVQMIGWFGGWGGPAPRVPVQIPYAPLALDTENCYPDPPCPPEPEPEQGPCHYTDFTLQARDRWGAIAEARWAIRVCGGCTSQ